ncbi:MAG TPA: GNAT family N-acetyltransferase [Verrucomicrobiota bacterium]|nr:GNAT family N-acetyltransferase [Verrucomicrobiota bacterium]HQB17473.1 GNAT family N-acetyltransferase [Verrucomicrobiota bacterium]
MPVAAGQIVFLKAVVNGKIIGAVRGYQWGEAAFLRRLIVHPYFWRRGIGRRLVTELEQAFPQAKRFEIFTGRESTKSLGHFRKLGYQEFQTAQYSPAVTWVYMQKERQ